MAITPDGMGADRYNERINMREASRPVHLPPWELAALDADGNEVYRTERFETQREAEKAALALNVDLDSGNSYNIDPEVDTFRAVRRE